MVSVLSVEFVEHLEVEFGERRFGGEIDEKEDRAVFVDVKIDASAGDVIYLEIKESETAWLFYVLFLHSVAHRPHRF